MAERRRDLPPNKTQIWMAVIAGIFAVILASLQIVNVYALSVVRTATVQADTKLDTIHTLVNSNMGRQLRISAIALRRLASVTNDKEDKLAATEAEAPLAAHLKEQAIADRNAKSK